WSGARLWGVQPDMMTTAKAITNGYFPFGALMIRDRVAEVFEADDTGAANVAHGYTYSGHPVGAAAALACLAETREMNVITNAAIRGQQLYQGAIALKDRHEQIGDVRGGHGLMVGLEFVRDRASKAPDTATPLRVRDIAYKNGVLVRVSGPNIILSPPLIVTEDDVSTMISALDAGLKAASKA
ncbi:MAG: aminotransferase class III-fold pyridoxal phosphate-dependent enzyme, partial [Boseongicola sp.]